jgi:hypothetical protein
MDQLDRLMGVVEALDHPTFVSFREAGRADAAFFTSEYCPAQPRSIPIDSESLPMSKR